MISRRPILRRVRLAFYQGVFWLFSALVVSGASDLSPEHRKLASEAMLLLHANCLSCHDTEKHKGDLILANRESALQGGENGPALVPGDVEKSLLLQLIESDGDPHMPPKKQLSTNQIALLRRWIEADAPWDQSALTRAAAPRDVTLQEMSPDYQPVLALALSPDGARLAVGRSNRILVYETAATNGVPVAETQAHADVVRSLAWSPDGTLLASGSFREVKLWSANSLEPVRQISSHLRDRVTAVRFTPYGGAVVVADGAAPASWIRLFDVSSGKLLSAWRAHDDAINDLTISVDGGLLATAGADKVVKLWELISQKEVARIEAHMGAVRSLAFNTNASELVTVGADKQLKVWDVRSRQSFVTIEGRKHAINAIAWSGDGKMLAAGDEDGRLYSFSDFKQHTGAQSSATAREKSLGRWPSLIHAVAINSDGSRIYGGAQNGVVYAVDQNGKLITRFEPAKEPVSAGNSTNPPPSFVHDVLPLLAKAGCSAGGCHAKPEGQNGFKLSVFSYDPKADFDEMVVEARGRRIFPASPTESLILLKPTMQVEHGGGQRIEIGSETYETVVRWIRGGMVYQRTNEPSLTRIAVEPRERIYRKGETNQLKVTAHYSDGSTRDVTSLADYAANDKELVAVDEQGSLKTGSLSGEAVVVARFMGVVDTARITIPADRTFPAEKYAALPVRNFVDDLAYKQFQKLGLLPSDTCTDAEFLRRSSLDAIGMLPTPEETRSFLESTAPDKRKKWIEQLLSHPAYGDYWANKWADLLRPNPDRVGVKSVFVLDQWLREMFRTNAPYDQFARAILTAEGSNHRFGPAVVYRDRREPAELTTMFSQLFLGVRMECAKCHHHPNEKWSQDDFYQFAAFFGPVKQKGAGLSPPISAGMETFYYAPGGNVMHPVTGEVMKPRALDGPALSEPGNGDPRVRLADWLIDKKNPFFAKAAVNRVWSVFFGRGFVDPVDDFRVSNPASNEALLEALADDFVRHNYDLKHLVRTILESNLYQLSSLPNETNLTDTKNFSRSYRRRLPAEVLLDAVSDVTGVRDQFSGMPPGSRAVQTWTYKVPSHFLDAFGRPNSSSDCPCERDLRTSVAQSLHLMNSTGLQAKLSSAEGRVKKLVESKLAIEAIIEELYVAALNRLPTSDELARAAAAYTASTETTRQSATEDVLWALLNSPEFIFNH